MAEEQTPHVGIIVAAHADYGSAMLRTAEFILGSLSDCSSISVDVAQEVSETVRRLNDAAERLDKGAGVIVLTDMFGGTPTNLALSLLGAHHVEVVTGVNLPMLLKVFSCREKPLEELDDVQRSAVHAAQVRGVEPAIEYGRMYLIRRLGNRLNAILPFHDEYETTFTEAADVELRHMMYYRNRLNLQPEEMTLLDRLYHARNCISHLGVLDFDVVELLLKDALNWQ